MSTAIVHAPEINSYLTSKGLAPDPSWTTTFLASQRPNLPLPSLRNTALFRLLNSDITSSLLKTTASVFPRDVHNAGIKERALKGPIAVQVLDIEDIGRSRWSQFEAIEADERGETTRGREIIRIVPTNDEAGDAERAQGEDPQTSPQQSSAGPHKLLLQDAAGQRVYGFELKSVPNVNLNMSIGAKLVLRDVTMARGVLLLEPSSTIHLAGKLEDLHKKWKADRKNTLKAAARQGSGIH